MYMHLQTFAIWKWSVRIKVKRNNESKEENWYKQVKKFIVEISLIIDIKPMVYRCKLLNR